MRRIGIPAGFNPQPAHSGLHSIMTRCLVVVLPLRFVNSNSGRRSLCTWPLNPKLLHFVNESCSVQSESCRCAVPSSYLPSNLVQRSQDERPFHIHELCLSRLYRSGAGGERFRITGIDPKRPKYPVSAERLSDRRGFKFTAENIAMLLKAQSKP